jgi:multiple sugar transport system permease protein
MGSLCRSRAQSAADRVSISNGAVVATSTSPSGQQFPIKLAASLLMTVPVAIVFFIFQKRIMNVGAGAVKE